MDAFFKEKYKEAWTSQTLLALKTEWNMFNASKLKVTITF